MNNILKNSLINKVANSEKITVGEAVELINSKDFDSKGFGIKAVLDNKYFQLISEVLKKINDKDEIIVSDALDCLRVFSPKDALSEAYKHIESKSRYVQASSLFIFGECGDKKELKYIKKN